MKDNFRLCFVKNPVQMVQIPHVACDGANLCFHAGQGKQGRLLLRRQGIARDLRTGKDQHPAEPSALKAGVSCYENPFSFVKLKIFHYSHTFQGASPEAQSFSRSILSRRVSIHCQKPLCL